MKKTIRDHRLTAAVRTWARAQLQAPNRDKLARQTTKVLKRARHVSPEDDPPEATREAASETPEASEGAAEGTAASASAYPFARTICACADCVRCCHDQPGSLAAGDLERIAAHLGKPLRVAALAFWASPGALVLDTRNGRTFRIGTITPKRKGGRCVFLSAQDRCTIHAVAPAGCAIFDTHMDADEGQRRGQWLAASQRDAAYQSLRRTLPEATSYRPVGY